jgi:predicted nucleic acid-binding protein
MPQMLVDTDILIDASRLIETALERLEREEQSFTLAISTITKMELIVGCRDREELQKLNRFLQRYQIIEVNKTISSLAAELMETYFLSHGLLIADAFVAATAIALNIPLLSKNQRDYRFVQDLNLPSYP